MVTLRLKESGKLLGSVSDEDFSFLADELEEDSVDDTDYYIDPDTIDMLEEDGAPESLIAILRLAVGDGEGADITWSHS